MQLLLLFHARFHSFSTVRLHVGVTIVGENLMTTCVYDAYIWPSCSAHISFESNVMIEMVNTSLNRTLQIILIYTYCQFLYIFVTIYEFVLT